MLKLKGVTLYRSTRKRTRGMGMRRLATVLSVFLVAAVFAPAALADGPDGHGPPEDPGPGEHGPSWEQLEDAGWFCFDPDGEGPLGQHCVPPGSPMHLESNTTDRAVASNVMVFDATTDGFAGTELLRFTEADLSSLPCPKDGGWHEVEPDFWACHHWRGAPEII